MNNSFSGPCTCHREELPGDRITLTGLEVFAHHGVFDFEREQGQRFVIDAEAALDLSGIEDALEYTLHYGELAEAIQAAVQRDPVDLIETVAERIAGVVLAFAGVRATRVTVHKPDAPIDATFADVAVTVVRHAAGRGARDHCAQAEAQQQPQPQQPQHRQPQQRDQQPDQHHQHQGSAA